MSGDKAAPWSDADNRRGIGSHRPVAGLFGAGLLAAWFLAVDVAAHAQPFLTPSMLSTFVFDGAPPDTAVVTLKGVFAYSGLHVILFLIVGWMVALMFREFVEAPDFGTAYLLIYVVFHVTLFGVEISMMRELFGLLGTWAVALGNTLAAVGMFWFMLRRYPDSLAPMAEPWQAAPDA